MRREDTPGRGVWFTYVWLAALFAGMRVFVLASSVFHPLSIARVIEWVLRPEILLPVWPSWVPGAVLSMSVYLILGSFVFAAPVLPIGWLLRRMKLSRPIVACYLLSGTVLAIVRIGVLVSARGMTWTAPWHLVWILWPEALLLIETRFDPSFLFAVLLAIGSYILAAPILLVGWLSRR